MSSIQELQVNWYAFVLLAWKDLRNWRKLQVVARPHPTLPLYLWGDESDEKYRAAYFSVYPGM